MKLLQVGTPHKRNEEFIIRACNIFNIEYYKTDMAQFSDERYDIIWAPLNWIHPDLYPTSKFIFGPHFSVFPDPLSPLFTQSKPEHTSRCIYTCLSDWNIQVHRTFADITKSHIPFLSLPFGLEDIQSKSSTVSYIYDCIIYYKHRDPSILTFCESVLKSRGLTYKVYRYGSYDRTDYIETLKQVRFAVWLGCHESQGFAFQECLATNTPMYVYDVKSMKEEFSNYFMYEHYKEQLLATSAPYWDATCGTKVYSNEEFESNLSLFIDNLPTFNPASYVQRTLTDRVCFQRFLDALTPSKASYDNFTYFTNDNAFLYHINIGQAEPYGSGKQLDTIHRYITKYPTRCRTMIDVGAHIGTTMLPYSRIFTSVFGYEPNKESYYFCTQNILYNNVTNCSVENCAILDRHIKGNTVYHNTCNTGCIYFKEDVQGDIQTKILDEDPRLVDVDFLKIDTEGAELLVIKSAMNIIKKYKPFIQAEINGLSEKNFNISSDELRHLLNELGYINIPDTDFFMHNEYTF